jgi:anaerobic selenocysteine-containing dehydrogenase
MLAGFLIDALNVLTGNLDRQGGAMFPLPAQGGPTTHGRPGPGRGMRWGRWRTRVRGLQEFAGELPVAALAEEIDTAGDDRVRAAILVAGNPVLSAPNGARLDRALPLLDCQISVDIYLNETSRHAHVVLPSPRILTRGHGQGFPTWNACHNFYDYSPPLLPRRADELGDGEILLRLAAIVEGRDPNAEDVDARMAEVVADRAGRAAQECGTTAEAVLADLHATDPAERLIELSIRTGPYGDRFGGRPGGLTFRQVRESPDGVDLGPLRPRLADILRTASGRVELAPDPVVQDAARLRASLAEPAPPLLLFGRRDRRSMNSWLHNVGRLATESDRCTVQLHPIDAAERGIVDGSPVRVTSRVGAVTAPVEVTDAVMPGTVCLPHGFGHDRPGPRLRVAALVPGASNNDLTDDAVVEPWSGVAVFSGVPVEVAPA